MDNYYEVNYPCPKAPIGRVAQHKNGALLSSCVSHRTQTNGKSQARSRQPWTDNTRAVVVNLLDAKRVLADNAAGAIFVHASYDRARRTFRPSAVVAAGGTRRCLQSLYKTNPESVQEMMGVGFLDDVPSALRYVLSRLESAGSGPAKN